MEDIHKLLKIRGIQRLTAVQLLHEFGTFSAVIQAPAEELEDVPHISRYTAVGIRKHKNAAKDTPELKELCQLSGIGTDTAQQLLLEFGSVTGVKQASEQELVESNIIEQATAEKLETSLASGDNTQSEDKHEHNTTQLSSSTLETKTNRIQASGSDMSWKTMPANERIDEQFLVYVTDVTQRAGDRESARLSLCDQDGWNFRMTIWSKHDIRQEWREGEWYSIKHARSEVQDSTDGPTQKQLSSTKDLSILELGADFDPNTGGAKNMSKTQAESQQSGPTTSGDTDATAAETSDRDITATTGDSEVSPDDSSKGDEEDVLGDILSDFDEL